MKILIVFSILFTSNFIFCQIKKDTITIEQSDIIIKVDTIYSTRTKPIINFQNFNKKNGTLLTGLYRINIDDNTYFITNYKNGIEDSTIFNYKKGYRNGKLKELEIMGYQMIGEAYISIPEYNCNTNSFLDGFTKEYSNDMIIDKIRIRQKIRKKVICWKIYYPNKTVKKIKFNKTLVDLCR
ncbi:hypothetical protein [Chryseobacterium luquanense]|uniref:GLPGLI family protein n=1 Tax=Chryseobacterium luquanense TaxID=2983766 RepID=A0ABT3Y7H9_9FLAO|nr:hypothetical protein [Chryseobacterium luquanense]MCX8534112.1 hypothetical protein [Chryseobacterium luquanense]